MGSVIDCRRRCDRAAHRASRAGRVCGAVYLTCLAAVVGVWCAQSMVAADGAASPAGAAPPARGSGASPLDSFFNLLAGQSKAPVAAAPRGARAEAETIGHSEGLLTDKENPDEYQTLRSESLYPPTPPPQKLTEEQLEAISKLAPKVNKSGMRVHPAMVPLFRSMTLLYTGGTYNSAPLRFRLHVPEPYQKGKTYPLVIWLHGAGECGSDNVNQLSHLHHIIPYLVGPKKREFFLLVPQCPLDHSAWEAPEICSTTIRADGSVECRLVNDPAALADAPLAFTLVMADAVMKEFPVDRSRVTVAGLSTGGDGVWRILERRPDLFAAAVPLVSWEAMQETSLRDKPLLKKIPIWAIYSSDDRAIDYARKEFQRMQDHGCHVYKTEFGVCGHRAWTPAMLQGDIFGWLISRGKKGDQFFSAAPSPTSPEKIGIFADVTDGDLARQPTKAVPGAQPAGSPVPQPSPVPWLVPAVPSIPASPQSGPAVGAPPPTTPWPQPSPGFAPRPYTLPRPYPVPLYPPPAMASVDEFRVELMARYVAVGDTKKALEVADKIKNRQAVINALLRGQPARELLDYVDKELDRWEQHGAVPGPAQSYAPAPAYTAPPPPSRPPLLERQPPVMTEAPLQPVPAGKKTPMEQCGKEWSMSTTTLYGLFPNGWDQEANRVPGYIVNESGRQLRERLNKAFTANDLAAMKEFCDSFIRLDDIPLASPWFDTSGGRLQGRIKYTLNEKARPVVELLREIARVKADSKKELVDLAQKALARIDAITSPKAEK